MAGLHRRPSRRAIAAGAAFVVLLGSGVALLNDEDRATVEPPPKAQSSSTIQQAQRAAGDVSARLAPLQLPELVAAVSRAAAAYARGEANVPANIGLADQRFEISLAFGCHGADRSTELPLSWSYDEERQALTLRAAPQNWPTDRFASDPTVTGQIEAIEGFWIPRPWLPTGQCPVPVVPPPAPPSPSTPVDSSAANAPTATTSPVEQTTSETAPRRTMGLAQFFPPGAPRWRQRAGEAYEIVARLAPEELQLAHGFELVLRGRVAPLPNGQVVRCHSKSAEMEPVCLVSVEINSVAFRNPHDGKLLAEWDS